MVPMGSVALHAPWLGSMTAGFAKVDYNSNPVPEGPGRRGPLSGGSSSRGIESEESPEEVPPKGSRRGIT